MNLLTYIRRNFSPCVIGVVGHMAHPISHGKLVGYGCRLCGQQFATEIELYGGTPYLPMDHPYIADQFDRRPRT